MPVRVSIFAIPDNVAHDRFHMIWLAKKPVLGVFPDEAELFPRIWTMARSLYNLPETFPYTQWQVSG